MHRYWGMAVLVLVILALNGFVVLFWIVAACAAGTATFSLGHTLGGDYARASLSGRLEEAESDVKEAYQRGWKQGFEDGRKDRAPPKPKAKAKPKAKKVAPHWVILGLQPWASEGEITSAFRRLAMKFHPDHGGTSEQMMELNRAREAALKERA